MLNTLKNSTLSNIPVSGEIYNVCVNKAEIPAKFSEKSGWDIDGSAPDCYYQIWWRGNKIAESSIVANSLLPYWNNKNVDISNIFNIGKGVARIKIDTKDTICIKIFDADPLKTDDSVTSSTHPIGKMVMGNNLIKQGNVSFVLNIYEYIEK